MLLKRKQYVYKYLKWTGASTSFFFHTHTHLLKVNDKLEMLTPPSNPHCSNAVRVNIERHAVGTQLSTMHSNRKGGKWSSDYSPNNDIKHHNATEACNRECQWHLDETCQQCSFTTMSPLIRFSVSPSGVVIHNVDNMQNCRKMSGNKFNLCDPQ